MTQSGEDATPVDGELPDRIARDHPETEDHPRLEALLNQLELERDRDRLARLLEDVAAMLEPHFEKEEADGAMFDTIREAAPRFSHETDKLIAQHRTLLQSARSLRDRVAALRSEVDAESLELVRELCNSCRDHEAKEMDLLVEALYRDIGAND